MGGKRQETIDRGHGMGDGRHKTREARGDESKKTEDGRRDTGSRKQEIG